MDAKYFVEALVTHYPDLCQRITKLQGIDGNVAMALAADPEEGRRVLDAMMAVCHDFQDRAMQVSNARPQITEEEAFDAMALALTTALSNTFALGVWLGENKLARFPRAEA